MRSSGSSPLALVVKKRPPCGRPPTQSSGNRARQLSVWNTICRAWTELNISAIDKADTATSNPLNDRRRRTIPTWGGP